MTDTIDGLAAVITPAGHPSGQRWWRRAGRSWLELFCLSGFAVAQPLLDVYGRAPEVFIFVRAAHADIVLFGLVVVIVPPTLVWAIEQAVSLVDRRAGRVVHLGGVALFLVLLAVQVLRHVGLSAGFFLAAGAVAVAGAAVTAYVRFAAVRQWLVFAAFAPVLFLGLFLGNSRVSDLLAGQDVAAAEVEVGSPRSIVMMIWDEWPLTSLIDAEGGIDADLYPNLAALAGDGAWFRNTTGVSNGTAFAVPSVLTGRHPPGQATSAIASAYPENLFTLLAGEYDLEVIESYSLMCPPNLCDGPLVDEADPEADASGADASDATGEGAAGAESRGSDPLGTLLTQARSVYRTMVLPTEGESVSVLDEPTVVAETGVGNLPDAVAVAGDFDDEAAAEQGVFPAMGLESVDQLIASIEPDEGPTLHFAHMQLPHVPYRFLPSRQEYALPAGLESNELLAWTVGERSDEAAEAAIDRQRSILQMGYVDALLGDIVQRLEDVGLYDDSVIVMTSDHGAGFVPGEVARGLGLDPDGELDPAVHADLLYVPLIVKGPGFEPGTVRDDNVMTIDVLPTIADLIDVDPPWSVDGISLLAGERASAEKQYRLATLDLGDGSVESDVGTVRTFDGDEVFAEVLRRHTGTLLADDNAEYRPYAIGDAGDLVGRPTAGLVNSTAPVGSVRASIGELDAFADVELREPIPAFVEGRLTGSETPPSTLAISLGGRIAAVTSTYPAFDEPHTFRALLAPNLIRAGANRLEVWSVEGVEGDRRLVPIPLA